MIVLEVLALGAIGLGAVFVATHTICKRWEKL